MTPIKNQNNKTNTGKITTPKEERKTLLEPRQGNQATNQNHLKKQQHTGINANMLDIYQHQVFQIITTLLKLSSIFYIIFSPLLLCYCLHL